MDRMRFKLPPSGANTGAERNPAPIHQQIEKTAVAPAGVAIGGRYRRAAAATGAAAPTPALKVEPKMRVISLPDALIARLDESPTPALLSEQSIWALWDILQTHTENQASARGKIYGGVGGDHSPASVTGSEGVATLVSARFADIPLVEPTALPDSVRVGEGGSRYFLHANQLALRCGFDFIAAQKPLAAEVAGFLHLLVARKVALVVDLTTALEQENDASYVPRRRRNLSFDTAHVSVTCKRRRRLPANRTTLETLQVRRSDTGEQKGVSVHTLERLHFAGWPDHGAIGAHTLRALAIHIEALHARSMAPILVHCLAGVGRTGTLVSYIAVRARLRTQFPPESVSCRPSAVAALLIETILKGRADRGDGFVQTREQFGLVLTTLLEESVVDTAQAADQSGAEARTAPAPVPGSGKLADRLASAVRWMMQRLTSPVGATHLKAGSKSAPRVEPTIVMPSPPMQEIAPVPATTPLPVTMPPANAAGKPMVRTQSHLSTGNVAAGYRRAIAEHSLLASCFETAVARLDQVGSVAEVDQLVEELVTTAPRTSGPDAALSAAQAEILRGAVLQRFHRRERGIIFQAHLVSQVPNVASVPAVEKPAARNVSAKATVRSDA